MIEGLVARSGEIEPSRAVSTACRQICEWNVSLVTLRPAAGRFSPDETSDLRRHRLDSRALKAHLPAGPLNGLT